MQLSSDPYGAVRRMLTPAIGRLAKRTILPFVFEQLWAMLEEQNVIGDGGIVSVVKVVSVVPVLFVCLCAVRFEVEVQ